MLNTELLNQSWQYLNQVLGGDALKLEIIQDAKAPDSKSVSSLPYFLRDAYEMAAGQLLGQSVVLVCGTADAVVSAGHIRKHTAQISEALQGLVIFVTAGVSSSQRLQLIQHGVPFVVPGSQLYAPQLGAILSERFAKAKQSAAQQLSPATQALFISYLLQQPSPQVWHPFAAAQQLGYTAMTATRAQRELVQFELFELETQGRAKHLKRHLAPQALWEKAKPYLQTPVAKTHWTYDERILAQPNIRWAGTDALARLTMLGASEQRVVAVLPAAITAATQAGIAFEPSAIKDGIAVQVWRYAPTLQAADQTQTQYVDSLSLWLSLQEETDDRVQMALNELEESFPW